MKLELTTLVGVYRITPETFLDFRGSYTQTFSQEWWSEEVKNKHGISMPPFVTDCVSVSHKNVLRGFHGNTSVLSEWAQIWPTGNWKLVTCLKGEIYSVILNNIKDHTQYLQCESFMLSEYNKSQLLIAPGMGNSILAMSDNVVYSYKQTQSYAIAKDQFTVRWNDPAIKDLYWPIKDPILSERDAQVPFINESVSEKHILP